MKNIILKNALKLVRDKIPTIIQSQGLNCDFMNIERDEEYEQTLKNKLIEEAFEVENTKNDKELMEELADCYEVIAAIEKFKGLSHEEIEKIRIEKKQKKGGFEDRVYMITYEDFEK